MTVAVSSVILRSMRMINEKPRGATLDATEQVEVLYEFNSFLDSMAIERLYAIALKQESFALTVSTNSYTIGSGGAFNTVRPTKIVDPCFVRDANNLDSPVRVIDADAYGGIVQKGAGYTYPTYLFYDHQYSASGLATIYLYPSPAASLTLFINSWQQLASVSTVSQQMALPPGYQLFLESNFAIHLAAGFKPIPPETAKIARDSKAAVKALNIPDTLMDMDAGIVRGKRPNIFAGT